MKKALLISYYYPPMPAVGSIRARGITKYLPEFGWEVEVVHGNPTAKGTLVHRLFRINPNQNLKAQANELRQKLLGLPIDRLLRLYAEIFAFPDPMTKWGEGILNTPFKKPDAIISTSSPVTDHIVAMRLQERWDVPWIADLRDLWTQNHYYPYSRIRKWLEEGLETRVLSSADVLTTVSEPLADKLKEKYGNYSGCSEVRRRVVTITNGYDPDEVNQGTPLTPKKTITYTGNIYPEKQRRSIELLLQNLVAFDMSDAEIRFFCPYQPWLSSVAKKYRLEGQVRQYGWVSRDEALHRQRESHTLLLPKWDDPEEHGIYSQKLFEYVAAKRPILVIGRYKDVADQVVEDANNNNIEKYSQREMARKFAEVLDGVAR